MYKRQNTVHCHRFVIHTLNSECEWIYMSCKGLRLTKTQLTLSNQMGFYQFDS